MNRDRFIFSFIATVAVLGAALIYVGLGNMSRDTLVLAGIAIVWAAAAAGAAILRK